MEYFIIALREGVEAALVIGIIVAYLRRTGRAHLIGWVWLGLGLALVASVVAAFTLPRLFQTWLNEEAYEGVLMLIAAVMIGTLVVWLARAGKEVGKRIEARVEAMAVSKAAAWGVVVLAFLMVFREGVEVVLLYTVLDPGTDAVVKVLGSLAGLTLAVIFGVGFVRGTARIDLGRFFKVTTAMLVVLVVLLVIGGLHEFAEAGLIPVGPKQMAVIGPIVHNNVYAFSAVLLVGGVLVMFGKRAEPQATAATAPPAAPAPEVSNGPVHPGAAAERKRIWQQRTDRRWRLVMSGLVAVAVVVLTGFQIYSRPPEMEVAAPVADVDGTIRIAVADVEDGELHFYEHPGEMGAVRLFVMKIEAGRYEVCLDACEICGPKGYYLRGPELVCRNCVAPISIASVGNPGGCNPVPVPSEVAGGEIRVAAAELHRLGDRFYGP